jgi:oligopeptide/dipeptide ABC transporter ATP-binding protein
MTGPSQLVTERLGAPPQQLEETGADESLEVAGRTPWQLFSERFRQDKVALVALGFIAVEILLAIFAPLIVRTVAHPPDAQYPEALDPQFGTPTGPSSRFLFGVDSVGHDVFSRLGKIVELADPDRLYAEPKHPYTGALLSAVPVPSVEARRTRRLVLKGDVPSPTNPPRACRFHTRCPKAQELCREVEPPLEPKGSAGQLAACHFPLTRGEVAELVTAERFRAGSGDAAA